jgi:hypothetical protein
MMTPDAGIPPPDCLAIPDDPRCRVD